MSKLQCGTTTFLNHSDSKNSGTKHAINKHFKNKCNSYSKNTKTIGRHTSKHGQNKIPEQGPYKISALIQ